MQSRNPNDLPTTATGDENVFADDTALGMLDRPSTDERRVLGDRNKMGLDGLKRAYRTAELAAVAGVG